MRNGYETGKLPDECIPYLWSFIDNGWKLDSYAAQKTYIWALALCIRQITVLAVKWGQHIIALLPPVQSGHANVLEILFENILTHFFVDGPTISRYVMSGLSTWGRFHYSRNLVQLNTPSLAPIFQQNHALTVDIGGGTRTEFSYNGFNFGNLSGHEATDGPFHRPRQHQHGWNAMEAVDMRGNLVQGMVVTRMYHIAVTLPLGISYGWYDVKFSNILDRLLWHHMQWAIDGTSHLPSALTFFSLNNQ